MHLVEYIILWSELSYELDHEEVWQCYQKTVSLRAVEIIGSICQINVSIFTSSQL